MTTAQERRDAFMADLRELLRKHHAEISQGRCGHYVRLLSRDVSQQACFCLPTFMCWVPASGDDE